MTAGKSAPSARIAARSMTPPPEASGRARRVTRARIASSSTLHTLLAPRNHVEVRRFESPGVSRGARCSVGRLAGVDDLSLPRVHDDRTSDDFGHLQSMWSSSVGREFAGVGRAAWGVATVTGCSPQLRRQALEKIGRRHIPGCDGELTQAARDGRVSSLRGWLTRPPDGPITRSRTRGRRGGEIP